MNKTERRSADPAPRPARRRGDAYTGVDLVTWGAVVVLVSALIATLVPGMMPSPERQQGVVPGAIRQTGTQLNVFGSIAGFSAVSGQTGGVAVWRENPDPDRLGGVGMTLSLFIGSTGGIDMVRTVVLWSDGFSGSEVPFTKMRPVICPNWTVVNKLNVNPFKTADEDDILEPGEQFDVFVCPLKTYAPYDEFTVEFDPPGPGPHFPVKCTVPFPIKRTMEL